MTAASLGHGVTGGRRRGRTVGSHAQPPSPAELRSSGRASRQACAQL